MQAFDLERMSNPRGIAVIGASADLSRPGAQTLFALERHGYKGGVYPVNPRHDEVRGKKCFRSVSDIDGPCDVAVVALPAAQVPEAIRQCGMQGIAIAVVLGGGFRESGPEGTVLEADLRQAARVGGVRVIGPNCLGYVSVPNRVYASFSSLTRPPDLKPGAVSAVIQSGGFGNSLIGHAALANIGFRNVVASGNETDVNAPELIRAFADDPETKIILAYLEGLSDGRAFMSAARYALSVGKPLVVLKAGNTEQGARAAASHTAYMTSSYDIYRAAFKQCGVIETHDIDDTVDFLKCLAAGRAARGTNVAVIGGSGGSAVNFSDAADIYDLKIVSLEDKTLAVLKENLPSMGAIQNPVDYTASFVTGADDLRFLKSIEAILADRNVEQVAVLLALTAGDRFATIAQFIAKAYKRSDKPLTVFSSVTYDAAAEGFDLLALENIPVFSSPRRAAASMAMLARWTHTLGQAGRMASEFQPGRRPLPLLPAGKGAVDEYTAKRILSDFGIAVTRDVLVPLNGEERVMLPDALKFPVAVKIVSQDIAHKTDIGGVRLHIANDQGLAKAVAEVLANSKKAAPDARVSGVLISEMVADGLEAIIGVVNDRLFGPVVALGMGGIFAEVMRDITYRIAPFDRETACEMVMELRASPLFRGVRGQGPRDVEALTEALVKVSELAWFMQDRISELDINPILVRPAGLGAIAADALMVLKSEGHG